MRQPNHSVESVTNFPDILDFKFKVESPAVRTANQLTAFSLEFVAKPEQAASAPIYLPTAIQSGLEDIPGFAGSLVMVSDQEARLVTMIIFWNGAEARRSCERSVRRVRALLAPYLDRSLRTQNMMAHLSSPKDSQASSIDTHFIAEESTAQEGNICVA